MGKLAISQQVHSAYSELAILVFDVSEKSNNRCEVTRSSGDLFKDFRHRGRLRQGSFLWISLLLSVSGRKGKDGEACHVSARS
jgi:hypothetical protein